MASAGVSDVDQQVEEEDQEPRRVTIVLANEVHLTSQPQKADAADFWRESAAGFFRHLPRSLYHYLAEKFRSTLRCCPWDARYCCGAFYVKLAEKCPFRTLLLIYVCLNEVLRYHNEGGTVTAAAAISEAILVFLLLVEFVYDSISLGLWRGSAQFFHSRRCLYNFGVLLAAIACGALDIYARKKPLWYTAQFAFAGALGRFIRLFRVYQSHSFQVVHSIFKKSSFNLLALGGLCFLFALFYTIIFFHSYGYTQFNLCYKELSNADAKLTKSQRNVNPLSHALTKSSWNTACNSSSVAKAIFCDCRSNSPQSFNQGTLRSSTTSINTALRVALTNSSGSAKEMVCDANSVYWKFDTTQQYLCTRGRACHAGTTCRNVFYGPWTSTCSEAERGLLYRAGWDSIFENPVNDWGTTGFHSGISALTSLLQCMTLEGWSAMMYRQADGDATTRGVLSFVLILSVVILGNLLLMNLVVAVVWENTLIESTTLKKIDAREEDLQLFEILGMKWVRHLVQQLSRHDIFSSEEKMLAYRRAKYEAKRDKPKLRSTCTTSVSCTVGADVRAAADPLRVHAADSACSKLDSCAVSSGNVSSVKASALGGPSPTFFRASFAPAPSIVCASPRGPVSLTSSSKVTSCAHAFLPSIAGSSRALSPSDALQRSPFTSDASACSPPCRPTAGLSRISSVFSFIQSYWPRFRNRVFYAISRKQYVALMFCAALADLCCIVACTRTERESAKLVVDCIFTSIYFIDVCLQVIGFGWRQFTQDGFKVYDLIVVSVEVVGLLFHFSCCGRAVSSCLTRRIYPASPVLFNAYIFFRSFHAFRIFKLIRSFAALRILVELMYDLLRNIFFIYALVLFEVFTMSLMGVICFGDSHYEEHALDVGFPTITRFFNFSNIWKAFVLVYGLMTGESWNVVMSEIFAVYVNYNYSPSKEETLLPSHLFLKIPRLGYIITAYVFTAVILLCCFIFNVFGGILIGQFVTSRRLVYNRHVFKLIKICRELDIEMPSREAVGSANLQRMYSLVESRSKGSTARIRALSLFLQPEKIQERFSVASASPKARKIMTRVSSSFSKPRPSSVSSSRGAHPQATAMKRRGRPPAVIVFHIQTGGRSKRVQRMWHVTQNRRVLPKIRSRKVRSNFLGKRQREILTWCLSLKKADTGVISRGPSTPEASCYPDNKKVWAISNGSKTQSCLFYAVSHEDFGRRLKSPQQETTLATRVCSSIRTACLSLAIGLVWTFDAIVRLFFFCLLLLESQLVSLDTERPDFCIAYVHYILEDEYVVGQPDEPGQGSFSTMTINAHPQQRSMARTSTSSTSSQRRATADLPHFSLGGRIHSSLYTLMVSDGYDFFLAAVNVTSLLCLIVEACVTKNATAGLSFACLECIFAGFFLFENGLRMFVFGFLAGTAGTNALNLCLSLLSVIILVCNQAWLVSSSLQAAYVQFWMTPAFRTVKLLRSIRALQLLDTLRMNEIKLVARSLAASIGEMKNLGVLLMLALLVAGSIVTQITQCFSLTNTASSDATAAFPETSITGRSTKDGWHMDDMRLLTGHIANTILESLNSGGFKTPLNTYSVLPPTLNKRMSPAPSLVESSTGIHHERADSSRAAAYTFDNMTESLLGMFVLSTAEGWPLLLAHLLQQQPKSQRTILTVVIFVFVSLVAIFCVNLFVGIIVEASRRKKTRMEMQGSLLSPAIHKWIEVQKIIFDAPLQHGDTIPNFDVVGHKRLVWFRKRIAAVVTSSYYRYFDLVQIFLFCLILLFYGPWYDVLMGNVARTVGKICCSVAVALCCCFVAGITLKVVARGRLFFRDKLDILDLLICVSLAVRIPVALSLREQKNHLELNLLSAFWPMSFRLFRVARFLYRHVYFFRTLFTTISGVARSFLIALGLLGIALFFFALWGVLLFHDSPVQNYTNKYANFTNLPAAFMAVIGACTGEDWHLMLQQMRLYYSQEKKTTLEYFVVVFFVAFIIIVFFTLMSLFTSTVLEKYMETVRNESLWRIARQHSRLLDLWIPNEDGTLFKTLEATLQILQLIDFPIGLKNAVPSVDSPEAAYALLAKFELPLYYCSKVKSNPNCDFKKNNTGSGECASYKIHIRDVVLNAARRACKFHAISNGEGVLQEGQVALDPRLTQSWVAKFPELNRLSCVYNLQHFSAATTIQMSWRRRHLFVNGHVASPEWCTKHIINIIQGQVANRHQSVSGHPRPSSQGETRRDTCKGKKDREKRSSTESSSHYETLVSQGEDVTNKRCCLTANHQESWRTSSTVVDCSRRPSCTRCRSRGGSGVAERQPVVQDAPQLPIPRACLIQENASSNKTSTDLQVCPPNQRCHPAQCARREADKAAAVTRTGQVQSTEAKCGRRRTTAASYSCSHQSQQSFSSSGFETRTSYALKQRSPQADESSPATADDEQMNLSAHRLHSQRTRASTAQLKCEGSSKGYATSQQSTSRQSVVYGADEERMRTRAHRKQLQRRRMSTSQVKCEGSKEDEFTPRKLTSRQSAVYRSIEEQMNSPAHRRQAQRSTPSVSQVKCEKSNEATTHKSSLRRSVVHEGDKEQLGRSAPIEPSQRKRASASLMKCGGLRNDAATSHTSSLRQSVVHEGDEEQLGPSAPLEPLQRRRASASRTKCGGLRNEGATSHTSSLRESVVYEGDEEQLGPSASMEPSQRKRACASRLKCEGSKDEGAISHTSSSRQSVVYDDAEVQIYSPTLVQYSQRRRASASQVRCEGSKNDDAAVQQSTSRQSVVYRGNEEQMNPPAHMEHSQRRRASASQMKCEGSKSDDPIAQQSTSTQSVVYRGSEEQMNPPAHLQHSHRRRASAFRMDCKGSKNDGAASHKSSLRQSVVHEGNEEQLCPSALKPSQRRRVSASQMKCEGSRNDDSTPRQPTLRQSVVHGGNDEQMIAAIPVEHSQRRRASASQVKREGSGNDDTTFQHYTPRQSVICGGDLLCKPADVSSDATAAGVREEDSDPRRGRTGCRNPAMRISQGTPAILTASKRGSVGTPDGDVVPESKPEYLPGQIVTRLPDEAPVLAFPVFYKGQPAHEDSLLTELDSATLASKRRHSAEAAD